MPRITQPIEIVDWNADGRGRGQCGRRVALVSQAQPGDVVRMRIDHETRGTMQGRVARMVKPAPGRMEAGCPHAFKCTGCAFLGLPAEAEQQLKRQKIMTLVAESGLHHNPEIVDVSRPSGLWGYRCYAKQIVSRDARSGRIFFGSYVQKTHLVADNRHCPVLIPALAQTLARFESLLRRRSLPVHQGKERGLRTILARHSLADNQQLVVLGTSARSPELEHAARALLEDENVAGVYLLVDAEASNNLLAGALEHIGGVTHLEEVVLGFRHRIGPKSFFQINPVAAEVLFEIAIEAAGHGRACIDAYCGVGALTLPLSRHFGCVVGIESNPEAIAALHDTAKEAGLGQVRGVCADVAEALAAELKNVQPEAVVLDPPRKGIGPLVAQTLGASQVQRLVLLSCDPESLRRDLPALEAQGFWAEKIWPVDQFPRTAHVETVTRLRRKV